MKRSLLTSMMLAAVLGLAGAAAAEDAPDAKEVLKDPGIKVFTANKCNKCHTVKALDIKLLEEDKESKAPDLSNVGSKEFKNDWIKKFLGREVSRTVEGDDKEHKHKKKIKLEDDEWEKIFALIAKLKFEVEE